MSVLFYITKQRIFEEIVQVVQSPMKLLIADKETLKMISSVCKMTEMVDLNIALIECLEKKRYPFENMDALYFLTPTDTSISLFLTDWEKKPIYAKAHLFFTDHVSDELFGKISSSKARAFIRTFREVYLDFIVVEPRLFIHSHPIDIGQVYPSKGKSNELVEQIAKSICSLCISCKVQPVIRYACGKSPQDGIILALSEAVQNNFKKFTEITKPDNFSQGTLLILDRSYDQLTPFLHDFHYQALINDTLKIENGKKYMHKGSDGEEKVIYLDEEDSIFLSLKHMHLADCSRKLAADFSAFEEANKAPIGTDIARMQEAVANMADFQLKKEKYAIHLDMATMCSRKYSQERLDALAMLEQDLATGFDVDGDAIGNLFNDVYALVSAPDIDAIRKVRLIIVYIVSNGGIQEGEMKKLLSAANLPPELVNCFKSLSRLGINMGNPPEKTKKKKGQPPPPSNYDVSRFHHPLRQILTDLNNGSLSKDYFMLLPGAAPPQSIKRAGVSLRAGKPTWQAKKAAEPVVTEMKGEKTIVYILGGISYAEIMEVYQTSQQLQRDIIVGSTGVYTQNEFVEQLSKTNL